MNLHSAAADRQTYRENTIASFRWAAAAGASFVEFDVQVGRTAQSCLAMDVCVYAGRHYHNLPAARYKRPSDMSIVHVVMTCDALLNLRCRPALLSNACVQLRVPSAESRAARR